jgi:hypothetical protein
MKFHIVEFDRDYRTPSDFLIKEFLTREEAEKWCDESSWTGHDYFLDPRVHSVVADR